MAACDINALLADAKCFFAMPEFVIDVAQAALLCNISTTISGGGGPGFLSGHGSPEGVVTGAIQGQTYEDLDTGALYLFAGTPGTNTGWGP
jgi:hypothetical protein